MTENAVESFILFGPELRIERARFSNELCVCPSLCDSPLPQYQDFISIDYCGEPVSDEYRGLSVYNSVHCIHDILWKEGQWP